MRDLPPHSLGELLDRVRCCGIEPVETVLEEPPGDFHGERVGFDRGTLYWHMDSPVHGFCHEAGHALLLPSREEWAAVAGSFGDDGRMPCLPGDIPTDEDAVLVIQCEMARGLEGAGVKRMLRDMDEAAYQFNSKAADHPYFNVLAATWWRQLEDEERRVPTPWSAP